MKLYIDESGNTGETLSQNGIFNFQDQPFYVLSGILVDDKTKHSLERFVVDLKNKHKIQGNELKSKGIYKSKSKFISELIDYLILNKIPIFTELMDKLFYIHIQLIEYFIVPYYSLEFTSINNAQKRLIVSEIGRFLNEKVYDEFIKAVKENTNSSLESFYDFLINHFDSINEIELKKNVELTKEDYFEEKAISSENALKKFFPIPDKNPNDRLIHLLPNYNAFTNLLGRTQKYMIDFTKSKGFSIIHDEQKQFDIIFKKALKSMKEIDSDSIAKNTNISEIGTFNLNKNISLNFVDSKTDITIQVADILAGFVMRFWIDFINKNNKNVEKYLPLMSKLTYPVANSSIGINYVVPIQKHQEISEKLIKYYT